MANSIPINNIVAFPSVRANTREMRSFTEQNVANLISHLFVNMSVDVSEGKKDGFSVCEHTISNDKWVLFNLGGRFFDVKKSSFGNDFNALYVGIKVDTSGTSPSLEIIGGVDNNNYEGLYYGSENDVNSCTYKIQLYSSGNLNDRIHLYVGDSTNNNAYQTKSQIDNTYATITTVTSLENRVNAIENISTIDGGKIS